MTDEISLLVGVLFAVYATAVFAQSTGPRDLAELKQEAQRRADRSLPPVGGVKSEDMREALANINNLEPDTWAAAFVRIGDRYVEKAKSLQAASPKEAAESYKHAWEVYNTARWPIENSPGKKQAYAKALDAFQAYGRLIDPPLEIVRIPFEGKEIVGYLRLPANVRPAPLLIGISGLDTRKEDVAATSENFHAARHWRLRARHAGHRTGAAEGRCRRRAHVLARARLPADAQGHRRQAHRGARPELERLLGGQSSPTRNASAFAARSCTASASTAISSPSSSAKD